MMQLQHNCNISQNIAKDKQGVAYTCRKVCTNMNPLYSLKVRFLYRAHRTPDSLDTMKRVNLRAKRARSCSSLAMRCSIHPVTAKSNEKRLACCEYHCVYCWYHLKECVTPLAFYHLTYPIHLFIAMIHDACNIMLLFTKCYQYLIHLVSFGLFQKNYPKSLRVSQDQVLCNTLCSCSGPMLLPLFFLLVVFLWRKARSRCRHWQLSEETLVNCKEM